MMISISTNMYTPSQLENVFLLLEEINDQEIGIELFPEWQDSRFGDILHKNLANFKNYRVAFHGPYYDTEHSASKGSPEYIKAKGYFLSTLKLAKHLNSEYVVYHHNNCKVHPKNRKEIISNSQANLLELNELAKIYGVEIVVENAGVLSRNNMLFDEEEFIATAKRIDNKILIDIGHVCVNNWNLDYVISELKDKISAYHLHNNDGVEDNHNRIRDGKLNIDKFFELYNNYTPHANLVLEYSKNCSKDTAGIIADINYIKSKIFFKN